VKNFDDLGDRAVNGGKGESGKQEVGVSEAINRGVRQPFDRRQGKGKSFCARTGGMICVGKKYEG